MWGKVLAGVVIGVGAVAAAPFTGGGSLLGAATLGASLSGATTIAAASGAGLAGAAAGKTLSDRESRERRSTRENHEKAAAEASMRLEALEKSLTEIQKAMNESGSYFRGIIALEAVGVACAACDGDFSENEKLEIGEFVRGMQLLNIPAEVKNKIEEIYNNPPSITEAYQLAKESGIPIELYDEIIKFVMEIDGVKEEEKVFAQAWDQLKAA